jgi:hypothetical protein
MRLDLETAIVAWQPATLTGHSSCHHADQGISQSHLMPTKRLDAIR